MRSTNTRYRHSVDAETAIVFCLTLMAGLWLVGTDSLTGVKATSTLSLNAAASIVFVAFAALHALLRRRIWVILAVSLFVGGGIVSNRTAGFEVSTAQYLLTVAGYLLVILVAFPRRLWLVTARILSISAFVAGVLLTFDALLDLLQVSRSSQAAAPIVVIILLFTPSSSRSLTAWLRVVIAVAVFIGLTLQTARMASATVLLVLIAWIFSRREIKIYVRVALSVTFVGLTTAFWALSPVGRDRMFARDASLNVGAVTINAEGRTRTWELIQGSTSSASEYSMGGLNWFLGNGIGYSASTLRQQGFILDNPHSEIVRVWFDGGLLFSFAILLAVALPLILGLRMITRQISPALGISCILVSVSLGALSLTDNPLSYSWVMFPASIWVALVHSSEEVAGGVCPAPPGRSGVTPQQ